MAGLATVTSIEEVKRTWDVQGGFVLIEDFGTPEYEVGRIISPITMRGAKKNPEWRFGKVIAVGPGRLKWSKSLKKMVTIPVLVKPDDLIIYWKFHGTHTRYETEDGFVLRILANFPEDKMRDQVVAIVDEPPGDKTMEQYEGELREHSWFKMKS